MKPFLQNRRQKNTKIFYFETNKIHVSPERISNYKNILLKIVRKHCKYEFIAVKSLSFLLHKLEASCRNYY